MRADLILALSRRRRDSAGVLPSLAVITPCSDGGGQCAGQGQKTDCTGGPLCRELNANQGIAADVSRNKTSPCRGPSNGVKMQASP